MSTKHPAVPGPSRSYEEVQTKTLATILTESIRQDIIAGGGGAYPSQSSRYESFLSDMGRVSSPSEATVAAGNEWVCRVEDQNGFRLLGGSVEINQISQALQQNTMTVLFLNVLLQQLGLPVPAVPTMLLAGSMATTFGHLGQALTVATLASVLADALWYWLGTVFGYRVLAGLCKLSINPGSCVSQTEARFIRWGVSSLVLAKFIPGFSTVAPPIAGALRMSLPGFLLAAGAGASLWAGLALGAGWALKGAVQVAISSLDEHAGRALLAVLLAFCIWLGWKLWQKYRFRKYCAIPHITPAELIDAQGSEQCPLLLDLRGATMIAETGPIPGAIVAEPDFLREAIGDWPKNLPIVTLCACPEDASAILAARRLLNDGYLSVRPLQGGYDAWIEATRKKVLIQ